MYTRSNHTQKDIELSVWRESVTGSHRSVELCSSREPEESGLKQCHCVKKGCFKVSFLSVFNTPCVCYFSWIFSYLSGLRCIYIYRQIQIQILLMIFFLFLVKALIEQEVKNGIPSNRIILGGFSQVSLGVSKVYLQLCSFGRAPCLELLRESQMIQC